MGRLIYVLVIVVDALVIIDILRSNKDMEKKVLWIIAVVFLPALGPILYFILGRR